MNRMFWLIALLVPVVFMPPPAAADEFYIVRDASGECRVVQGRPADMAVVVVTSTAYTTEENALGVIRTVCAKH